MAETLNLVNPNDVLSCKYEISKFPDGQQSIRILEHNYCSYYSLREQTTPMIIKSRLNTFQDLEIIICANQVLKEIGVKSVKLYIPYCIGGRSDRKFQEGGVNYIKSVISPIINSQNFDEVIIMDPHSDVLEACINNFSKITNHNLVQNSLFDYWKTEGIVVSDLTKVVFVSPDAGALKKVVKISEDFQSPNDVIICSKHRDENGKLTKTSVPLTEKVLDKDLFILDDICDGGATFINIAKEIKNNKDFKGKIYLVVTHGIFSRGFDSLSEFFDKIYTTNSIKEHDNKIVKQFNIF